MLAIGSIIIEIEENAAGTRTLVRLDPFEYKGRKCTNTYIVSNRKDIPDGEQHGVFRFHPEDQFATYVPLADIEKMATACHTIERVVRDTLLS